MQKPRKPPINPQLFFPRINSGPAAADRMAIRSRQLPIAAGRNQPSLYSIRGQGRSRDGARRASASGFDGNHLEARREAGLVEGPALLQAPRELLGRAEVDVHLLLLLLLLELCSGIEASRRHSITRQLTLGGGAARWWSLSCRASEAGGWG